MSDKIASPPIPSLPALPDDEDELTPAQVCAEFKIPPSTLWRNVSLGYFPPPSYSTPRRPRWTRRVLRAHKEANRRLPREAKELRRRDRLARERS